ncbi:hypothetical protein NOVOSPHI9U_770032 [Novosphingobium sp. 9U]|nr:hypothetical protein NOVOSPHI9U_770032 [Novosphingobium sp. 9U]
MRPRPVHLSEIAPDPDQPTRQFRKSIAGQTPASLEADKSDWSRAGTCAIVDYARAAECRFGRRAGSSTVRDHPHR